MLDGPGALRWEEAPDPELTGAGQAIVRPVAVATCDIDPAVLRGAFPLAGPYAFGHEGVAEVVATGPGVTGCAPGDLVIVPFQISCGRCAPCSRGRTGNCAEHPRLSTYGLGPLGGLAWGGLWADLALVPHADAMLVPLPGGVDPVAVASASDNIPDAYRTVAGPLADEPGAEVLVVGGGGSPSIGLYAAGLAVSLGSARVVYLDHEPSRLAVAEALGAEPVESPYRGRHGTFPVTVDASGDHEGVRLALRSTAYDGVCTVATVYFEDPPLPLFGMYTRCCTLRTGRAHVRPDIPAVLDLVASGRFDPRPVTSDVVPWEDAPEVLAAGPLKLVASR
ncbi:alcohol dehydrogenase catalytic domain-containing protein [Actinocorallia longicatena]|uniref:Alcohol dehydrogenase catalytic domain-containing protein n=2 Tax=Actinocorallia longicatena TaxID=111803 RepID=A0ABP6QTR7_9ACTN